MRWIKKYNESSGYDNVKISESDLRENMKTRSIPFRYSQLKELIDYFCNWEFNDIFYSNQKKVEGLDDGYYKKEYNFMSDGFPIFRIDKINHHITISVDDDDYYYVFDWNNSKIKHMKCDDMGGLKEYFDKVFEKDIKIDSEDYKKKMMVRSVKDSFRNIDLESFAIDKLSELKKYIDSF